MVSSNDQNADREHLVEEAIAAYYQAREKGESIDRNQFLAKYPDLHGELESFLADKALFEKAAGKDADPHATLPPTYVDANAATGVFLPVNAEETQALSTPVLDDSLGTIRYIGDYELLSEIARGGMGVVFKARQVTLDRVVAVKMILAGQLASKADLARFEAEAQAAANLDHPNILHIYEVGKHQGQQYFSMKLVEGGNLGQALPELVGNPKRAVELLTAISRAVHFAHQRGILHRDLKPANILIDEKGTPYVTDFGLARKVEGDSGLTQSGAIVGTPSYMAPEQARAEKQLSTAVDIYSLGAILYEALTGKPPFRAATVLDTILQVVDKVPDSPRVLNPKADRDLSIIAMKCLEKDPAKRYESAGALAEELERWSQGEPIQAREANLAEMVLRWLKRNTAGAAAVMMIGLVWGLSAALCIAVAISTHGGIRSPNATPVIAINGELSTGSPWEQKLSSAVDFRFWPQSIGHPLGWARLVAENRMLYFIALIAAIGLTGAAGWIACRLIRSRDIRSTIATSAVTGLVAFVAAFFYLTPFAVNEFADYDPNFTLHPIYLQNVPQDGSEEAKYLDQFLKQEPSPTNERPIERWRERLKLRGEAIAANRLDLGFKAFGAVALIALGFFLPVAVVGGLVADYLRRSRARKWINIITYFELTIPTTMCLLVLIWSIPYIGAVYVTTTKLERSQNGDPSVLVLIVFAVVSLQVVFASLQIRSVIRRWSWWVRSLLSLTWAMPLATLAVLIAGK